MTKKKSVKKKTEDLQELKKQDQEWRRLRTKIHTQLDNAIDAFMYAVESQDLEVEKAAIDHLTEFLFNPNTIQQVEKAIKSDKKILQDLISASRELAAYTVEKEEKKKLITKKNVEQAIKASQEKEIWPFHL